MKDLCRLCLIPGNGQDIFKNKLDKLIEECFGIKLIMLENWPSHACPTCLDYLMGLRDFKEKIETTQESLKKMEFQTIVKEELIIETFEEEAEEIEVKTEEIEDIRPRRKSGRLIHKPEAREKRSTRVLRKERSPPPVIVPEKKAKRKYEKRKIKSPCPINLAAESSNNEDTNDNDNSQTEEISKPSGISKAREELRAPYEEHLRRMNLLHCEKCIYEAVSFRTLTLHYRNEHDSRGYVTCCRKKYTRHDVHDHMRYHMDETAFKCDECGKLWKSGLQLRTHKSHTHTHPDDCKFQCEICSKKFSTVTYYNAHLKSHIPKDAREFKCNLCDRTFNANILLRKHILNIHTRLTTFVCEVCGKGLSSEDQLKSHSQIHREAKTTECDICGKQYFNLAQHKKRVHGPQTTVKCEYCGLNILERYYEKHVMRIHTHVKIYKCNVCGKEFKMLSSYNVHMDIHLGVKYDCYYCPHQATSVPNRIKHMKEKHMDDYMEYRRNKFTAVRVKNANEEPEVQ